MQSLDQKVASKRSQISKIFPEVNSLNHVDNCLYLDLENNNRTQLI